MSDLWARATAAVEDQIYGEITNWQEKVKVNEWLGAGILRITRELRKLIFSFFLSCYSNQELSLMLVPNLLGVVSYKNHVAAVRSLQEHLVRAPVLARWNSTEASMQ